MPAEIRKTLLHLEKTLIEGNKVAKKPLILIAAVAVIKNPWVDLKKPNQFVCELYTKPSPPHWQNLTLVSAEKGRQSRGSFHNAIGSLTRKVLTLLIKICGEQLVD